MPGPHHQFQDGLRRHAVCGGLLHCGKQQPVRAGLRCLVERSAGGRQRPRHPVVLDQPRPAAARCPAGSGRLRCACSLAAAGRQAHRPPGPGRRPAVPCRPPSPGWAARRATTRPWTQGPTARLVPPPGSAPQPGRSARRSSLRRCGAGQDRVQALAVVRQLRIRSALPDDLVEQPAGSRQVAAEPPVTQVLQGPATPVQVGVLQRNARHQRIPFRLRLAPVAIQGSEQGGRRIGPPDARRRPNRSTLMRGLCNTKVATLPKGGELVARANPMASSVRHASWKSSSQTARSTFLSFGSSLPSRSSPSSVPANGKTPQPARFICPSTSQSACVTAASSPDQSCMHRFEVALQQRSVGLRQRLVRSRARAATVTRRPAPGIATPVRAALSAARIHSG